eukprot:gene19710-28863_t
MLQLHATTPSLKERAAVKELVAVSNQLGAPAAAADHETGPRWLRAEQAATKDAKMLELVHLKVPSSVVPQPALFIASCANVHYVYMTLLDAQLKPTPDGSDADPSTFQVNLADVRAAVAAIPHETITSALEWRASFMPHEGGEPVKEAHGLKFKCVGARGGNGHSFTSDELKREVASTLATAHGMHASIVSPDCTVRAHIHYRRLLLGLRLNNVKLSTAADGGFAGSTGGIPFASAASGADGIGEHDATSTAGAAGAGAGAGAEASGTEERVPSGLDLLLDSDEANTTAATTALEAIAPWASVPYEEQCRRKHKACFKATVKFVRSCKQLWTKKNRTAYFVESKRRRAEGLPKPEPVLDTEGVPSWLVKQAATAAAAPAEAPEVASREAPQPPPPKSRREMFTFAKAVLPAPVGSQTGYRNKVVFTLGIDSAGAAVAGFRVANGLTAAAGAECIACVHQDMLDFGEQFTSAILKPSGFPTCGGDVDGKGVWHSLEVRGSVRTQQLMAVVHVQLGGKQDHALWDAEMDGLRAWCNAYSANCGETAAMKLKVVVLSVLDGDDAAAANGGDGGGGSSISPVWKSNASDSSGSDSDGSCSIEEVLTSPSTGASI